MAAIFCPVCGSKSEYKFATPNFCYKCGSAYNQLTNSLNLNKKNLIEDSYEDEDEDSGDESDFSNSTRVPRISRLQVEIDASTDVRVVKFEDLLNNNSSSFERPKNLDLG
jgi:hypothetical protein